MTALRKAKKTAWRNFVTLSTPWGKPYKVTMKYHPPLHIKLPLDSTDGRIANNYKEAYRALLHDKYPPYTPPAQHTHLLPITQQSIENYTFNPNTKPHPDATTPKHLYINQQDIKDTLKTRNKSSPGHELIRYSHLSSHPSLQHVYNSRPSQTPVRFGDIFPT